MSMIFALCLFAFAAVADGTNSVQCVPVVAAARWIKEEDDRTQIWIDKMTDGSYRESVFKKNPTVIRTKLIATNDVEFAWRFDYETKLSDGSVVTNASFVTKTQKERLNKKIEAMKNQTPPVPVPSTNAEERPEAIAKVMPSIRSPAAASMARAVVVRKRMENKRPVSVMDGGAGKAVITYADGRTEITPTRTLVSARIASPYEKKRTVKEALVGDTSAGGLAGTGAAAALAAAAGYLAGKKRQ